MSKIQELIEKYNLKAGGYATESPYSKEFQERIEARDLTVKGFDKNKYLNQKWSERIPKGWYGFDLSYPVPLIWHNVIDEFLDWVVLNCPDFKIYQIKLKFGGLRCYLGKITPEIEKECHELESILFDEFLVY